MSNDNNMINSISELVRAPRCTYVAVYTDDNIYIGYITHAISERFLDVLNQGSIVDKQEAKDDFLRLTDVDICTLDGEKSSFASNCLLNKHSTLFVAENKIIAGELPPAKPFAYTLYQQKKPIWVNITMPQLSISGQVYINRSDHSILALDTAPLYIPVKKVTIHSSLNSLQSHFDMIAINTNRVISILELTDN